MSLRATLLIAPVCLALFACASQTPESPTSVETVTGPQAIGISPDAPLDDIGTILRWSEEQTLVNLGRFDELFTVRTIPHGADPLELPAGAPIDPPVPLENEVLSIDELMEAYRVKGVIALHRGRIVFERYAHGHAADQPWVSMSAAKSITSTLVGAAIKDGMIGSVDDAVTLYIPELASVPAFDGVSLRHLMTMSSGLRWNEGYTGPPSDVWLAGGGDVIDGRSPIVSYAMKLTREHPPGTVNDYQNIDADLVGIALSNALNGRTVSDYLAEKIWRPAGMEADATWLLDKAGIERGGCCISARLRDYARFGYFIARGEDGPAGDMLPPGWIEQARTAAYPPTDAGSGYGWFWWIRADSGYEALGAHGQSITIYPDDDVVIAIQAASVHPGGFGWPRWMLLQALVYAAIGEPNPAEPGELN